MPTGDVLNGFELLADGNFLADAGDLLDYFEEHYIGRKRPTGERRVPLFPSRVWNVHERFLRALPRTNNNAEGWHRRFSATVACHHPTIWKFLKAVKTEQTLTQQRVAQLTAGDHGPPRKRKYVKLDRRLQRLCQTFEDREPLEFLRGIAHNFKSFFLEDGYDVHLYRVHNITRFCVFQNFEAFTNLLSVMYQH